MVSSSRAYLCLLSEDLCRVHVRGVTRRNRDHKRNLAGSLKTDQLAATDLQPVHPLILYAFLCRSSFHIPIKQKSKT